MLWTVLTVIVVAVCGLFLVGARMWPGRKSLGEGEEIQFRLWSGLWNRDDADRLR